MEEIREASQQHKFREDIKEETAEVADFSYRNTSNEDKLTLLKASRVAFCSQSYSINIQRNR